MGSHGIGSRSEFADRAMTMVAAGRENTCSRISANLPRACTRYVEIVRGAL